MSRADELREVVREATERAMDEGYEPDIYVLLTIVGHGGLSWEMVRELRPPRLADGGIAPSYQPREDAADILATILEAAGVEEGS